MPTDDEQLAGLLVRISEAQVAEDLDEQLTLYKEAEELSRRINPAALLPHVHTWLASTTGAAPPRLKTQLLELAQRLLAREDISTRAKAEFSTTLIAPVAFFLPQTDQPLAVRACVMELYGALHPYGLVHMAQHPEDTAFQASWLGCRQVVLDYLASVVADNRDEAAQLRRSREQTLILVATRALTTAIDAETVVAPGAAAAPALQAAGAAWSEQLPDISADLLSAEHPLTPRLKGMVELALGTLLSLITTPAQSLGCRTAGLICSLHLARKRPYLFPKFMPVFERAYSMAVGTPQAKAVFHTLRAGLFSFTRGTPEGARYASLANELLFKLDQNLTAWREEVVRQARRDNRDATEQGLRGLLTDELGAGESGGASRRPSRSFSGQSREAKPLPMAAKPEILVPEMPLFNDAAVHEMAPELLQRISAEDPTLFWLLRVPTLAPSAVNAIVLDFMFSPASQQAPPKDLATVLHTVVPAVLPLLSGTYAQGPALTRLMPLLSAGHSVNHVWRLLPHIQLAQKQGKPVDELLQAMQRNLISVEVPDAEVSAAAPGSEAAPESERAAAPAEDEAPQAAEAEIDAELYAALFRVSEVEDGTGVAAAVEAFQRLCAAGEQLGGRHSGVFAQDAVSNALASGIGGDPGSVLATRRAWAVLLARVAAGLYARKTVKASPADSLDQCRKLVVALIASNLEEYYELGLLCLTELYFQYQRHRGARLMHSRGGSLPSVEAKAAGSKRKRGSSEKGSPSAAEKHFDVRYEETLGELVDESLKLAVGDARASRWLARLLVEAPRMRLAHVERVVDALLERDLVSLALATLRDLIQYRAAVRASCLERLLGFCASLETRLRHPAILAAKKLASDHGEIEKFGLELVDGMLSALEAERARASAAALEEAASREEATAAEAGEVGEDDAVDQTGASEKPAEDEEEANYDENEACAVSSTPFSKAAVEAREVVAKDAEGPADAEAELPWDQVKNAAAIVRQHLDLYFALCHRQNALLAHLFARFAGWPPAVRALVKQHLAGLVRSIKDPSELLALLGDPAVAMQSPAAEELAVRVANLLIEQSSGRPTPALVAAASQLAAAAGRWNLNLLVLVVPEMSKADLLEHVGDLLDLLDGSAARRAVFRTVLARILRADGTQGDAAAAAPVEAAASAVGGAQVTPEELLEAFHRAADAPSADRPANARVKQAIEAISECFALPAVFPAPVFLRALAAMAASGSIPLLLARTLLQLVKQTPALAASVQFILRRMVDLKVWTQPALWNGFVLLVRLTQPHSLQLLAHHLELKQVQAILSKHRDLVAPLSAELGRYPAHLRQNKRYRELSGLLGRLGSS